MPISLSSPLLAIPADTPRQRVLALDGIRFGLGATEIGYGRLQYTLAELMRFAAPEHWPKRRNLITTATVDAWTVIDAVHRLRSLIARLPGLKQKVPEIRTFARDTQPAKSLRNFVQHLPDELSRLDGSVMPLWGSISWRTIDLSETQQSGYTIGPGTVVEGSTVSGPKFGPPNRDLVGMVTLAAGGYSANLTDIVSAARVLVAYVEGVLDPEFAGRMASQSDVMYSVTPELRGFVDGPPMIPTKFTVQPRRRETGPANPPAPPDAR